MLRLLFAWFLSVPAVMLGLGVSPSTLSYSSVASGPMLSRSKRVTVTATGKWKAVAGSGLAGMLTLSPADGIGRGAFTVSLTDDWMRSRRAGVYLQTIVVSDGATSQNIKVTLTVVEKTPAPKFTALSGPKGCSNVPGLPALAVCAVPGEKPPGNFNPPAVGGTYVDPNFGSTVKVLTGPRSLHGYSTPTAISATGKYVLVFSNDTVQAVDRKTSKVSFNNIKIGFEGTIWDSRNDDLLYYFSGATVQRYSLSKAEATVLADYSKAPYRFSSISSGGTGDASRQNWISFYAPNEKQVCALSLDTQKTYCAPFGAISGGPFSVDFTQMAKGIDKSSGKRYVLVFAQPAMLIFAVNENSGALDFEFKGPETLEGTGNHDGICDVGESCLATPHGDTFEDSQGNQLLMTAMELSNPCGFYLVTYQLNKAKQMGIPVELGGGLRTIMTLYRCGGVDNWADFHVGCARNAPLCAISTTYGGFNYQRVDGDTSPIKRTPYLSEIFVVRDNGVEVRRLAEHRSVPFKSETANAYWTTPRACMSMDGTFIVADSNYGVPNAQRVIVLETGLGPMSIAEAGVVNSASFESKIAPESLLSIFGDNLSNCHAEADAAATAPTLCGVSVKIQGQNALPYFVSPGQINVIAPTGLTAGIEATVNVVKADDPADSAMSTLGAAQVHNTAPAIFTVPQANGSDLALIQTGNGWVGPDNPLLLGETGYIYATGLGPSMSAGSEGVRSLVNPVEVYINEVAQPVLSSFSLNALYGLSLIAIRTDTNTPVLSSGNKLWLKSQSAESLRLGIQIAKAN